MKKQIDVSLVVAIISTIIAVISLTDSIITRNSSHLPYLKVESVDENPRIVYYWNENGNIISEDFSHLNLKITNIGNGNANNVSIEFNEKVLQEWEEKIQSIDKQVSYVSKLDNETLNIKYPYILMGTDDEKTFQIPSVYWKCLREMYTKHRGNGGISIPPLSFNIQFSDIQNITINYNYEIKEVGTSEIAMDSGTGIKGVSVAFQIQERKIMVDPLLYVMFCIWGAFLILTGILCCDYNEKNWRVLRIIYILNIVFFLGAAIKILYELNKMGVSNYCFCMTMLLTIVTIGVFVKYVYKRRKMHIYNVK